MTEEKSELLEELRWRGKQGFTRHTMSFQLSVVQVRLGATSLHRRMPKSMQHCIHGNMFVGVWTCTVHPLAMHNNCKNAVAVVGVIHLYPSCQVVVHVHTFWQSHVEPESLCCNMGVTPKYICQSSGAEWGLPIRLDLDQPSNA